MSFLTSKGTHPSPLDKEGKKPNGEKDAVEGDKNRNKTKSGCMNLDGKRNKRQEKGPHDPTRMCEIGHASAQTGHQSPQKRGWSGVEILTSKKKTPLVAVRRENSDGTRTAGTGPTRTRQDRHNTLNRFKTATTKGDHAAVKEGNSGAFRAAGARPHETTSHGKKRTGEEKKSGEREAAATTR